ncbi:hypothetical protein PsorP6_007799 [Peronosclerospora sorghi]|uniref:Uncharacterized protein n=1 Tax=Peronosclerospora sorghi TaxID=230839 RepID=A0ACC0WAV7_9STRA|nr:hypothetical protein PsorP6_007799 [Peronosclerospora sorghi]
MNSTVKRFQGLTTLFVEEGEEPKAPVADICSLDDVRPYGWMPRPGKAEESKLVLSLLLKDSPPACSTSKAARVYERIIGKNTKMGSRQHSRLVAATAVDLPPLTELRKNIKLKLAYET